MIEDSTFESASRIHTRSRGWMVAVFAFNTTILLALIVIPLIYPEALPQIAMTFLMEAPPPVTEAPRPTARPQSLPARQSNIDAGRLQAPPMIPTHIWIADTAEPQMPGGVVSANSGMGGSGSPDNPFGGRNTNTTVVQAQKAVQQVSKGVMAGLLIHRVVPDYPPIPRTMRIEGTVVLQATIARNGSIENLRVLSGPALLQQAALDAVAQWRYRPYLLNGQPVEVETTVNVEFKLQ